MPGTGDDHIVFDGWSRGEYGKAPAWDTGWRLLRQRLYYAGAFTATNVQRSLHGSLYPRCGLSDITPTGVPTGKLLGFCWTDVPDRDMLWVVGNTVYDAPSVAGGAATAYTGTFAITPTVPVAFAPQANGLVYASVFGDKTYQINQTARTVTPLTNSPGGACIAVYGDKLMVANVSGHPQRVFFSGDTSALPGSLSDFTKWDALNFLDIGDSWPVNALLPQRTALVIAKQRSWHLLTGTPGVNDVLRVLNQNGPWVQDPAMVSLAGDNTIWFVDFNKDTPNAFTGATMAEEEFLSFNAGVYGYTAVPPTFAVCRGYRNHDVFMGAVTTPGGPLNAAMRQDGAWTFHSFNPSGGFQGAWVVGRDGHSPGLRMSNGGATGVAAKFYAWNTNRDRPPISGQPLESIGDASSTPLNPTVTLPEYWSRSGEEITVRSVVVDFVGWNHGYSDRLHFDVNVQALDTYGDTASSPGPGGAGTLLTHASPFDKPASWAGSAGASKMGRATFNFDGEMGNGWQLSFSNLRGVEIKKAQVKIQLSPMRGT